MITLSLGHSIMYVPMRNVIQCMGDMALMPKICEKQAQRRAAAETVARKLIEHFTHSINN